MAKAAKEKVSEQVLDEYEAYKHINSLFGDALRTVDQLEKVDFIKTKSISLDRALGIGGWPRGRIIQLAGAPSSGKSLLSLLAIAEWQSLDPENCAIFIDAEYTYDAGWAAALGVDNDRILLIKNNSGVDIFTGLVGGSKVNAATKKVSKIPGLLDYIREGRTIRTKNTLTNREVALNCSKIGVIVLDSIASVNTPTEEQNNVGKQTMAIMGRFLSTELKKLVPAIAKSNVAFIAINQVRTEPGVMFGDPTTTSGGNAWKHACSIMVMLAQAYSNEFKIYDDNEEQIGGKIKVKIAKNKVAPPFKEAEYDVLFGQGIINQANELLTVAILTGVIKQAAAYFYYKDEKGINGRENMVEFVNQNFKEIEEEVIKSYSTGKISILPPSTEDLDKYEEEIESNPLVLE